MADDQIPNDAPHCKNCRFLAVTKLYFKGGTCRRNAPTAHLNQKINIVLTAWPEVKADDWCGQHEQHT